MHTVCATGAGDDKRGRAPVLKLRPGMCGGSGFSWLFRASSCSEESGDENNRN